MEMERTGIHQEILSRGSVFRLWIRRHGVGLAGLVILAGLPFWLSGIRGEPVEAGWPRFLQGLLIRVYLMAVYALSYDLLMGYTGILSFGHALFFGGGAYIIGILLKHFQAPLLVAMLAVTLFAMGISGLVGALSLRVRGVYLAMVTLALAQAAFILSEATDFRQYTGAEDGLQGIPVPAWLDPAEHRLRFYYLAMVFMLGAYFLVRRLVDSPTGRVWIALRENEEVYTRLGLAYIPPELREGRGEIEAALEGRLPRLIEIHDLQGDLQVHSTWSDGQASIREMARAAKARGYRYMLLTDHSQSLGVAKGLTPERLWEQRREIEAVNAELGDGFRVLHGAEVEIRADGSLDYPDEVLAALDLVVASVHTGLRQDRERVTARFLAAIRHPYVHIIAHPTGRLLGEREGADADWEAILRAAAETGTLLEINANPARLDLPDGLARRALELGCKLVISTDAHSPGEFDLIHFGVAVARRAWATPEDIANTWPLERLLAWAKEKPRRLGRA